MFIIDRKADFTKWYKSQKTGEMLIAENKFLYSTKEEAQNGDN